MKLPKLLLLIFFLSIFSSVNAQVEKMQAAFIYNFTLLVNWPASSTSGDFVIAVVGKSPINKELEDMSKQKKTGNQTIVIKQILSAAEVGNAQMVYIPNISKGKIAEIVSKTASSPTLVVTETAGASTSGSIINFVLVDEKLRFEVNEGKATAKGLKLAANLLKLGIPVK